MATLEFEARDGYVTSNDFKMHYLEWGKDGRMIVALHSMMLDAHSFDLFSKSMARDARILAIDLLGHGDSDKLNSPISLEQHMEVIRGVVKQRKFTNFTLIGHSIGGFLSMAYVAKHPTEVSRLILVDVAPWDPSAQRMGPRARQRPSMILPRFFNSREEASRFFEQINPKFSPEGLNNRLKYGVQMDSDGKLQLKMDMNSAAMLMETNINVDFWPYVKQIKVPTLVIRGVESQVVSKRSLERMKKLIKDFSVVEVAGAGHFIPLDCPKEFEEAVRNFIR